MFQEGEGLFPVRWMAPESLVIGIFTSLSDVWSFGVLMWEITSLDEQPYIVKTNKEVISYVRAGDRLPMTLNCPSMLYQLMLRCWSTANARPNFKLCLKNIIALRKNIEDALLNTVDVISRFNVNIILILSYFPNDLINLNVEKFPDNWFYYFRV